MKNEMSIKCPHLLDDLNYGDWNIHMNTFIKSLGMEIWKSIVIEWLVRTKIENEEMMIKPDSEWSCETRNHPQETSLLSMPP